MGSIFIVASYLFKVDGLGPFSEDLNFTDVSEMIEVLSILYSYTETDF
jgi:hypothetical protein